MSSKLAVAVFAGWAAWAAPARATTISYQDFSNPAGLQLNGSAAIATDAQGRSVLRLTPAARGQDGSAFATTRVAIGSAASFSASFVLDISQYGGGDNLGSPGADGLVFTLQTSPYALGSGGGGLGFAGSRNGFGIKLDTYRNPGEPSDNFVTVVQNGSTTAVPGTATASPVTLKSGTDLYAWVDFDGTAGDVQFRLSNTPVRPAAPLIDYGVNLSAVLGSAYAYAGFTGATGGGYENNDIVSFGLSGRDATPVPEPASGMPVGAALLLLCAGGSAISRRRSARAA